MAHRGTTLVMFLVLALVARISIPSSMSSNPAGAQSASPVAATPVAATQVAVTLPTAADLGISLPSGIDVSTLAATPIDAVGTSTLLRLERVTVPPRGE